MNTFRLAIRSLRAAPAVSAVAILSFALGIGANTAVFSLLNAILLKPLPYPDPDRLFLLGYTFSGASVPLVSETKLNVWKEQTGVWQDVAALRTRRLNLVERGQAEQLIALQTNVEFFTLFGARTALGRAFNATEDRPGGDRVVLLADGFWKRRFGADPRVVGAHLLLDGMTTTVVGVLEESVDTTVFNTNPDVLIPLQLDANSTSHPPSLIAAARLSPDATPSIARAQARLAGEAFRRRFPQASGPTDTFTVMPLHSAMVRDARASLFVLAGAVAFVLLIACANIAILIMIRGSARWREMAIRAALGATRWQIVRPFVIESLLLAIVGGGLGLMLAAAGMRTLLALNPVDLPRLNTGNGIALIDWRVLLFATVVSAMTGMLSGFGPALRLSRGERVVQLRSGSSSGATVSERRVRTLLATGEMALALVLVIGAMLLIRTFAALNQVDRGYDPQHLLTLRVGQSHPRFTKTSEVERLVQTTVQRVTAIPGVLGAAATRTLPLESDWRTTVQIIDHPVPDAAPQIVSYRIVSPEYFDVLRIPILRGRALTNSDGVRAAPVALINRAMAQRYWPDGDALNARIIAFPGRVPDDEPPRQVIGIVSNVRDGMPLEQHEQPTVYVPLAQLLDRESTAQAPFTLAWVIRTAVESRALTRSIQREISRATGGEPVTDVGSMRQVAARAIAPTTFSMMVLIVFGACALLLAGIGLYGVITHSVQQRAREIAIRLAVGARWIDIRNMVLLDGLKLVCVAVAVGLTVAATMVRWLTALLYGVLPHDVVTFAAAALLVCTVAMAAVWVPARRAAARNPSEALRRFT